MKTNNMEIIKCCEQYFCFDVPSVLWAKRRINFDVEFHSCENSFCKMTLCM